MYTSFHFCSVVYPVVLWMPETSFLYTSWWAQAAWGSPILSRPSSSTEGGSVSHPVLNGNTSLWGIHLGSRTEALASSTWRGNCVWKLLCCGPRVWQGRNTPGPLEADSPRCYSLLQETTVCPSLFIRWDVRPLVSLLSSVVPGESSWERWRGALMLSGFSSFPENFWIHLSHP